MSGNAGLTAAITRALDACDYRGYMPRCDRRADKYSERLFHRMMARRWIKAVHCISKSQSDTQQTAQTPSREVHNDANGAAIYAALAAETDRRAAQLKRLLPPCACAAVPDMRVVALGRIGREGRRRMVCLAGAWDRQRFERPVFDPDFIGPSTALERELGRLHDERFAGIRRSGADVVINIAKGPMVDVARVTLRGCDAAVLPALAGAYWIYVSIDRADEGCVFRLEYAYTDLFGLEYSVFEARCASVDVTHRRGMRSAAAEFVIPPGWCVL